MSHISFVNLIMSDCRGDVLVGTNASHLLLSSNIIRNAFGKCVALDGGAPPQYPLSSWSKNVVLENNSLLILPNRKFVCYRSVMAGFGGVLPRRRWEAVGVGDPIVLI